MSEFFINRPIFASVISIVIVIAGVVSFTALPIAKFPQIAPPTVQVTAVYPGADAGTIAETVATPIEQEVNGVEGMIYMSSTSASDGSYTLTVTFEVGTDMDMASVLVQNRVAIAEAKLPAEVRQQGITTKKQSTQILQFIALLSPDASMTPLQLSNFSLGIKDELSRLEGVGSVQVFGAGDYSMRIWLDPQKLKERGLTTEDVVNAIREQNVQVAAGQIGAPPAPPGTAFQLTVNTQGRFVDKEQFENIIVATSDTGGVLRVKDIAEVQLGGKDYTYDSRFNGKPSSSIAVYQLPEANAMETAALVQRQDEAARGGPQLAPGPRIRDPVRHDTIRHRFDQRSLRDAVHRGHARDPRDLHFSAGLAGDAGPRRRDSGLAHRDVRGHEWHRLFDQHVVVVRRRTRDRDRGRRRDRRRRELDAAPRNGAHSEGRRDQGDVGNHGSGHRHDARAAGRVHPERVHGRHHGATVPAIRARRSRRPC